MNLILKKPNTFGALASALCMVHCIATPFLFIAHTCAAGGCANTPIWWKGLDYLFLVIAFFAIYRSAKTTSQPLIKYGLWTSWVVLGFALLNEHLNLISLPEFAIYIPTIALVILHLYNHKYCQCKTDNCYNSQH